MPSPYSKFMLSPYSKDFCKIVVKTFLKIARSKKEIALMLNIGRRSVQRLAHMEKLGIDLILQKSEKQIHVKLIMTC